MSLLFQPSYYQELSQKLQQLSDLLQGRAVPQTVQECLAELKIGLQGVQAVELGQLEPTLANQVYAYQVEIDKQLRLLELDVRFLHVARQSETAVQRQAQMCDRVRLLMHYCDRLFNSEA